MKVEYTAQPEEAADAIWRWTIRTKAWSRFKRRNIALVAVLCASVAIGYELRDGEITATMLVLMLIVSAFWTAMYGWSYDHFARRRILKFVLATYGSEPFSCAAELRQSGLGFAEKHLQGEWDWNALQYVTESERGIELSFDRGIVVVPGRAFTATEDRQRFVARARELSATRI